jgi:Cas7 group CRISPR-associated protein Csh2
MTNQKINRNILNSRQILFLFDARDCNPNGERETGMEGPRIDPLSGRALITDVCFKFNIRNYFIKTYDSIKDNVLMRR